MAVNLAPPDPARIAAVPGVELGFASAGIRKAGRRDLMLMRFASGTQVAGVFTRNRFAAAPVRVCREHLAAGSSVRAVIVNAGNANCGTGARGLEAARRSCALVARALGCEPGEVLPFSTGVILEHLPVDRIEAALPECVHTLSASAWADAAAAIMTTDTVPKAASRTVLIDGRTVTVTGIAKGVGMLEPDMATMLAFVATDAAVAPGLLPALVRAVADQTFNCVTVDGDTSTNDSFLVAATGASGLPAIADVGSAQYAALADALTEVAGTLAQAIARDGEGATKFITVEVNGAATRREAALIAKGIANSPLVKTAFFASDPNLGRLIMAIGNAAPPDLDPALVGVHLGAVRVIERGERCAGYREADGVAAMQPQELVVRVELGRGGERAVVWTCDYSYDYVKINAEYRT